MIPRPSTRVSSLGALLVTCLLLSSAAAKEDSPKKGDVPASAPSGTKGHSPASPIDRPIPHGLDKQGKPEMGKSQLGKSETKDQVQPAVADPSSEERAARRAALKESRDARRAAKVAKIRQRWGVRLKSPAVQTEMRVHVERLAKLRRIQDLAEENNKPDLLERIKEARRREQLRYRAAMNGTKKSGRKKSEENK